MKYYINGKLIRTSKNTYTHAVLLDDKVVSCCGDLEKARKALAREIAECDRYIRNYTAAVKAIDEGKSYFMATYGRETGKEKITCSRETYAAMVKRNEDIKTRYSIRELEAR